MKMGDLLAQNFPLGYCIKPIFYAEAAKQGNEKALEFLANSYNDGFLTKKDKRAAYKLRHRLYQRNPDQFEQPIFEEYGLSDQDAETATAEDPFKGLPPFTFSILSPNVSLDMLGRVSISGGMCNIDKDYSSPLRAAEQAPH